MPATPEGGFDAEDLLTITTPGNKPKASYTSFLTKDGQPVMSFGVMGGNMQPQGHLQTLVRMLDYRQHPQAACDAPRWKVMLTASPLSATSPTVTGRSTNAA